MADLAKKIACPFDCGSSDAYSETYIEGGILGKCFSCGKAKIVSTVDGGSYTVTPTAAPIVNRLMSPYNIIPEIWNQYGLTQDLLDKHKIAYCSRACIDGKYKFDFLYLPCYLNGEFLGFQIKQYFSNPKYLTYKNDNLVYYTSPDNNQPNILVITEDWLSAISVGRVASALALCGTSLSKRGYLYKFIQKIHPEEVVLWLDPDEPGQKGTGSISKLLSNNYRCSIVDRQIEPKYLNEDQIKTILKHRRTV